MSAKEFGSTTRVAAVAASFALVCIAGCERYNPLSPEPGSGSTQVADTVAIADFNSDGVQDLAIGYTLNGREGFYSGFAAVLYQNAAGTFQHGLETEIGSSKNPWSMVATDLDNAGGPDLVVGPGANLIRVYLQNANTTSLFANAMNINYVGIAFELVATDLNGDGTPDLAATSNRDADGIALFFQPLAQRGTFVPATSLATPNFASALAAADMNNDGRPDLVASATSVPTTGVVSVYLHSVSEAEGFLTRTDYPAGASPRSIALADFDGDGRTDVAVANSTADASTSLLILFQDPSGGGKLQTPIAYTTAPYAGVVRAADLNGDGRIDIVVGNNPDNAKTISVLLQSSTQRGMFLPAVNYGLNCEPRDIAIGDINNDRLPDIALACGERARILFNSANSPGTFGTPTVVGR